MTRQSEKFAVTRRGALKTLGAGALALACPAVLRPAFAADGKIKFGAPIHRTGITSRPKADPFLPTTPA
ncbi:twin-arginine translocation signal domain-containing protein [Rhizobium sp. TRM95796]|uniref:twin-arginine translocation signal domain-containing protein n=1 Tax=Rhizobium sp. TRM95796 TaxID=2979862 RepID=UPI0021E8FE36|nr:twin-arginine translocation signal domain-containing protein [Rhizobium sp. TRM95796]MCV3769062.1 twin-arginine translocation signal domain-containing protein [Rhizobium sp. TRM95796]